jgi:hypothetical protein
LNDTSLSNPAFTQVVDRKAISPIILPVGQRKRISRLGHQNAQQRRRPLWLLPSQNVAGIAQLMKLVGGESALDRVDVKAQAFDRCCSAAEKQIAKVASLD